MVTMCLRRSNRLWKESVLCCATICVFDSQGGESDSHHSIVLCISRLVALMRDQKAKFSPRGLRTEYVGGDDKSAYDAVKAGDCLLVYMIPESLFSTPVWWEMLRSPVYQSNLVAFVVDEAHRVQKW